jgi:hypothetical protein
MAVSSFRRLGHVPLAISQAGTYLRERPDKITLEDFLELYERYPLKIWTGTREVSRYLDNAQPGGQRENASNVFTTWNLSIELLGKMGDSRGKLVVLSLLAFFDNSDISEILFEAYHIATRDDTKRPAWIAQFDGDDESYSWSTKRFGDLVSEYQRLSLISTCTRSGGGDKLHLGLHPLVRDWIDLRMDRETWTQYFITCTKMLALAILRHRPMEDTYCPTFRISTDERNAYLAHLQRWEANCDRLGGKTGPLVACEGTEESLPMTAQCIFASFYRDSNMYSQSTKWYKWIWDNCISNEAPWLVIRSQAGSQLVANLLQLKNEPEAEALARRNWEHWRSTGTCAQLEDDGSYILASILVNTRARQKQDVSEAVEILRRLLEKPSLRTPMRYLYLAELAEALTHLSEQTRDESNSYLQRIWEESISNNRRTHWPQRLWSIMMSRIPDIKLRRKITLAYVSGMSIMVGKSHDFHIRGIMGLVRYHLEIDEVSDALEESNYCLGFIGEARRRDTLLHQTLALKARCLYKRRYYTEALRALDLIIKTDS